jgi:alanine racemase
MFLAPTLTVSLPAIVANWQTLRARFVGEECAAVVKANAYGLGAVEVSTALEKAGCHTFFVATIEEGIELREALPDVRILVFHGVQAGEEFAFAAHRLIPVLNSLAQLERWKPIAAEHVHAVSALHIDTAMARMGLEVEEFTALLARDPAVLEATRVGLILSHFACAPEADHALNTEQLKRFNTARALAPSIPASLCNSGGIYLSREYHFDLARPGCSLYGIAPQAPTVNNTVRSASEPLAAGVSEAKGTMSPSNPMQQVATWHAPILATRTLEREQTVGYGATQTLPKGTRIATVASGYADGYLRHLSGHAVGYIGEHQVKLVGRVTMDMLCFDVSHVPESLCHDGAMLTLLGDADGIRVDDVAAAAQTIGYEVLTRIGRRVKRVYT